MAKESFASADTDFRVQLAKIKDANPDSLVMVGLANLDALILTQADELGLEVPVFDPGGITNNDTFLKAAGPLADGVVGNTPSLRQPGHARRPRRCATGTGPPPASRCVPDPAVFSYEGVRAVAAALAAGASGRSDLPRFLREIDIADTGVGSLSSRRTAPASAGGCTSSRSPAASPSSSSATSRRGRGRCKEIPLDD